VGCSELHDVAIEGDEKGQGFGPAKVAFEMLARRFPKHYSSKIQVSVEYELERFLDVAEGVLSPEDLQRLLAGLAALDSEEETGETPGTETRIH
jgi:hypothetical protein